MLGKERMFEAVEDYPARPEYILTKWKHWYDLRKDNLLQEKEHKNFVHIYEVLNNMTAYDRQILTEKYFNLKELNVSSFQVKSQTDSELAKKFKVSTKVARDQRLLATRRFKEGWKQVEINKQVFVVGEIAIKAKIISPIEYELTYLNFETDEVVKTEIIKLEKKGE